ncbi:MAG: hypothetical protein AAGN82_07065 [Myxococcota bacterium]
MVDDTHRAHLRRGLSQQGLSRRWSRRLGAVIGVSGLACGAPSPPVPPPAPPAATATTTAVPSPIAEPPPVAIESLRTGVEEPEVYEVPVRGRLVERGTVNGATISRIELTPEGQTAVDGALRERMGYVDRVHVAGGEGFAGVLIDTSTFGIAPPANLQDQGVQRARQFTPSRWVLWLRTKEAPAGDLEVALHIADAYQATARGLTVPVAIEAAPEAKAGPRLGERWREAVGHFLASRDDLPFLGLVRDRLLPPKTAAGPRRGYRYDDGLLAGPRGVQHWHELMGVTTGMDSVRAALQTHTQLRSEIDRFKPETPLLELTAPALRRHPWKAMLGLLGKPVPAEPLARATPADFFYVRAEDVGALMHVLDELEAWGTPLAHLLEGRTEHRYLSRRYRLALGLPGTELGKRLGPAVIRRLAVVGSDPFLRQGSDLTVIFEPKDAGLVRAGLVRELGLALEGRGEPVRETIDHRGTAITIVRTRDGAVHRHHASRPGLEIVSTSLVATRRVLDTVAGRAPALRTEPDFEYMLARDGDVAHQILAYAGDRFVARAVSPRSRVLDARRQVAAAELERPAQAALLHGWLYGRAPKDGPALQATSLLRSSDLRHFDGEAISFAPGSAPRSVWGRPGALTPLLDLPDPARVTTVEAAAYQTFVNNYEGLWSEAIDPIALRVNVAPSRRSIRADLRVLPLVRNSEYDDLREMVGEQRIAAPRRADGLRAVVALDRRSQLRAEISSFAVDMLGMRLDLDWVGDFAMVGVLDRPELANALRRAGMAPERPDPEASADEWEALSMLPIYAAVGVSSRSAAAVFITALRLRWGADAKYTRYGERHGTSIIRAEIDRDVAIHYALSDRALYVALQPWVLERLLDDEAQEGAPSRAASATAPTRQVLFDAYARPGGGLMTAIHWMFEAQAAPSRARGAATMLLLGAPSTRGRVAAYTKLALAYLGAVPLTVDATPFALTPAGVVGPKRGNRHRKIWPVVPVPGSPAQHVLDTLAGIRAEMSFDAEPTPPGAPNAQSLSVQVTIDRREAP